MTDQQIIVADDWTRNWQARIAVKITAMVLWVVILVSFISLVLLVWSQEKKLLMEHERQADRLVQEISSALVSDNEVSFERIATRIRNDLAQYPFDAIQLSIGGRTQLLGAMPKDAENEVRMFGHHQDSPMQGAPIGEVTTYHTPLRQIAVEQHRHVMMGVVLAIFVFGLFLTWVIHNVLSKPFQVMIDATQSVSSGNLGLRINFTRQDEFGHLSRFFNQMLDRIVQQQQELQETNNEELKKEINVRMEAEQALMSHRDHLETVVEERTADLAVARDQALQASQTKSAFIANISHEVRTPLTAIIGFAESILEGGQTEAEKIDAVKTVSRNGRHLLAIINNILDMSKMEADKLEVDKIAFSPFKLLSDIESLVGMQARDKGLMFDILYEFPLPRQITSDPTRLKQILLNLCSNAVKFTSHGSVRVNVSYSAHKHQMSFAVIDSGIGLSCAEQGRLFKAFSQADSSTTRKFGGTGLGLYISRQLANMLGGEIDVESIEGLGSKFIVVIDAGPLGDVQLVDHLEPEMNVNMQPAADVMKITLRGHVLLAEDSIDNQRLVSMYLRRAGVTVTVAENGKVAVEKALAGDFDLILMDMQMPVMDGLEAVKLLRESGFVRPIIALTANAMKEDQARYMSAGCDDFLSKPIDQPRFYAVLAKRLSGNVTAGQPVDVFHRPNDAEFAQLVCRYVSGLPAHLDELGNALSSARREQAREVAHKLKGTGGGFGFPEITRLAARLEASLKNGDTDGLDEQYSCLETEIERICAGSGVAIGSRIGKTAAG